MIRLIFSVFTILLLQNTSLAQITHYQINDTIFATGSLELDMNQNGTVDYTFDILSLQVGGFATRVITSSGTSILDASTFGYPDTLNFGDTIAGNWSNGNGVLGTFNNAGQFRGAGDKFLGVQFGGYTGWIELNSSAANDTLIIISAGYTATENGIFAGQTEPLSASAQVQSARSISIFPNPASGSIQIKGPNIQSGMTTRIYSAQGVMMYNDRYRSDLDITHFDHGMYFIVLDDGKTLSTGKFIVAR